MKKFIFLCSILTMLMAACSENDEMFVIEELPVSTRSIIAYSGETENVSVLIFGWDTNDYNYLRSWNPTWVENKASTNLEIGKYTFLFYKSDGVSAKMIPETLNRNTKMEDVQFQALPDPESSRSGYVLPVEEVWLQETADKVKTAYTISGEMNHIVEAKLTRAVSQLELTIKRGYEKGETFIDLPFQDGESIQDIIRQVTCDIKNVGSSISINGGIGSSSVYYQSTGSGNLLEGGFTHFTGPFVFPNGTGTNSQLDIVITPVAGSKYPEMKTTVNGMFERNKKLNVTLWLNATYELIYVSINKEPISEETEGDTGLWD